LPMALTALIVVRIYAGDLAEAATLVAEFHEIAAGTGAHGPAYTKQLLAAWTGHESRTTALIAESAAGARRRGERLGPINAGWAEAVLYNGIGRYEEAHRAARQAVSPGPEMGVLTWAPLFELITAAGHLGLTDPAALERLTVMTRACGTDWALGM